MNMPRKLGHLKCGQELYKLIRLKFPNLFLTFHQVDPTYPNMDAHLLGIGK
jgi:hypothetical protein